jgi:hypothetical protein
MQLFTSKVRDLVIPIGEDAVSPVVQGVFETQDAQAILIICPLNADGGDFVIEVSDSEQADEDSDFFTLTDDNGNAVLAPKPGCAKSYPLPAWPSWRIKAPAGVSVETVFSVFKSHY